MWLIGLLVGAWFGNLFGSGQGALLGGALGLVAGLIYGETVKRRKPLEERVVALEKTVRKLTAQMDAMQMVPMNPAEQKADAREKATLARGATHGLVSQQPFVGQKNSVAFVATKQDVISPILSDGHSNSAAHENEICHARFPRTAPSPEGANSSLPEVEVKQQSSVAASMSAQWVGHAWLGTLFKGNILAKIGVVILFFGIASALKLAVDMGMFPTSVRLMLGAVAAIAMGVFGYLRAQRDTHRMFGHALQGGGMGILYLLVYFMLARYQIIGEAPAFTLFTLLGVAGVLLAAKQDARSLAALGISGAFLSPVLAAASGGSQITLFSYFLLLNLFIISVNWFKGWRELNITGFIFTLVIGMGWAFRSYQPSDFPVSETFLILFFLLYSATPVVFNLFDAPGRLSWGDGMLLYGTPLAASALQNHLLRGQDMTLAWHACLASAYYLLLWQSIYRRSNDETVWLEKSLLAIAIGFFTLAIPLAFNAQLTSAFWTLEGFGVLYLGVKQHRFLARLSGSALQLLAAVYFLAHAHTLQRVLPVFNDLYVGCAIVVLAALASALLLQQTAHQSADNEQTVSFARHFNTADWALPFLYWAMLWWFAAGFAEIERFAPHVYHIAQMLGLSLVSVLFLEWLGTRRAWPSMRQTTLLLSCFTPIAALAAQVQHGHTLTGILSLLVPLVVWTEYKLLQRHECDHLKAAIPFRHALGYWFLLALTGSELAWVAQQLVPGNSLWPWLAWGAAGASGMLISLRGLNSGRWPFGAHRSLYQGILQRPPALLLALWLIVGNFTFSGAGSGLPYVPLLNPFDLLQLLVLFALWKWLRIENQAWMPGLYGIGFLWISAEAARIAHHWGGVPFEAHAMFASSLLQAGLSMLWTAIAMCVMVCASRKNLRTHWFGGFGLLAIVGMKLIGVDLSNKGTVLWSVSLIGIALLIIAASYFSPVPPRDEPPLHG